MSEPAATRPRGVARLLAAFVRCYQLGISPLLRPSCRFAPSCSEYAYESLCEHGALRGGWLSLRRLLRCHPFCAGGYDPVPPSKRRGRGQNRVGEPLPVRPPALSADLVSVVPVAAPASQEAGESPC